MLTFRFVLSHSVISIILAFNCVINLVFYDLITHIVLVLVHICMKDMLFLDL